jgi:hypothetical protein
MEDARKAIEAFMCKSPVCTHESSLTGSAAKNGKHDTTIHERVAPAVVHQVTTKTEHEVSEMHPLQGEHDSLVRCSQHGADNLERERP